MRPVDIGIDAVRALKCPGPGRVRAVFARALYLQTPGGLLALVTTRAPRGPLHIRVTRLPAVAPGSPITVEAASLRIGAHRFMLDAPAWSPGLPAAATLATARQVAQHWLPDLGPALDIGSTRRAGLAGGALAALRRGDLPDVAATIGGHGPGLTPAGDDVLAGVLLVARAICGRPPTPPDLLLRCARRAATNDIARAFLVGAARGRCIEPAHELLAGLARADRRMVESATRDLRRYGSSSGAALTDGIRIALLELPASPESWIIARQSRAVVAPVTGTDVQRSPSDANRVMIKPAASFVNATIG